MAIVKHDEHQKARDSVLSLYSAVENMIQNGIEQELNADDLQRVKNYYNEVYRHKAKFQHLMIAFVLSLFVGGIGSYLELKGIDLFFFSSAIILALLFVRYMYDEYRSTFVYISKLIGAGNIEIKKYIEDKMFRRTLNIRKNVYVIVAAISIFVMWIAMIANLNYTKVVGVVGFLILIDPIFLREDTEEERAKNGNR